MPVKLQEPQTESTPKTKKRRKGLIIWLIIILILFLLTTAILGSRLYEVATRDRYTVDLMLGGLQQEIELFRIEYANESGEIVVQGLNADNVVAPGTAVNYAVRLRNNDEMPIDFMMVPTVEFHGDIEVPVEFRVMDSHGNYVLGSENTWVRSDDMNALTHKSSIHPGNVFTYHISWRWVFDVSDEQNSYDTWLGNLSEGITPGVTVGVITEAAQSTHLVTKDVTHLMHLSGESFGCCWCCWLIWFPLLAIVLLLVWIRKLRKKLDEAEELAEKYQEAVEMAAASMKQ